MDDIVIDGTTYGFEGPVGHSFQTSTVDTASYNSVSWSTLTNANTSTAAQWNVWQDGLDADGTPSPGTGTLAANTGSNYIYAETSSPANVSGYKFWLRTPSIVLSSSPGNMTFYEGRSGATIGTLNVYVDIESI